MAIDIVDHHDEQKEGDGQGMHGHDKCNHHDDSGFDHCFQWVESKGRPGRWIHREMMDFMENGKEFGVVHEAMGPIEVRIVNHQHDQDADYEIAGTEILPPGIQLSIRSNGSHEEPIADGGEDDRGDQRIENFTQVVSILRKPGLNFFMGPSLSFDPIEDRKGNESQNQVPEEYHQE